MLVKHIFIKTGPKKKNLVKNILRYLFCPKNLTTVAVNSNALDRLMVIMTRNKLIIKLNLVHLFIMVLGVSL